MIPTAKTQSLDILHGFALLNDPVRNKGTAFTPDERKRLGLEGLLPAPTDTLDRQVERAPTVRPLRSLPPLLDGGVYLYSVSTMYRILRVELEVRERRARAHLRFVDFFPPEVLRATAARMSALNAFASISSPS